jgi:hypothetical protein
MRNLVSLVGRESGIRDFQAHFAAATELFRKGTRLQEATEQSDFNAKSTSSVVFSVSRAMPSERLGREVAPI